MTTDKNSQIKGIAPLSSDMIAISHLSIPEFEPSPRWVRTTFGGETVADSRQCMVLRRAKKLPVYCFPKADVRLDLLEPTENRSDFPPQGILSYRSIKVADKLAENAASEILDPADGWHMLKDYIIFDWGKMDAWYEEEEEVFVHLRDPYHRIDVIESSRHLRILVEDKTIVETRRPRLLFETGFPIRYYVSQDDVRMDLLEQSDLKTRCPYKGIASSYWTIRVGERVVENSVWSYPEPLPEAHEIKDRLCFFDEKVDAVYVDDELVPKPVTPWS